MPVFEVELRREKSSEVRIGEQALTPGETITVDGRRYLVESVVEAEAPRAQVRYVCVAAQAVELALERSAEC
jgi:hypothetical protein